MLLKELRALVASFPGLGRLNFFFFTQVQTPVTLCSGELWSILVVRLAHSSDLRSRLRHVSNAPSVAYSTGCSRVVTHPGTNPARRCLTSVIWREPVCHRRLAVDMGLLPLAECHAFLSKGLSVGNSWNTTCSWDLNQASCSWPPSGDLTRHLRACAGGLGQIVPDPAFLFNVFLTLNAWRIWVNSAFRKTPLF